MNEMNELCDREPFDLEGFYVRFRSLLFIYYSHSLEGDQLEWLEECVDETAYYLLFEKSIYKLPRKVPYFWWHYIHRTSVRIYSILIHQHRLLQQHLECLTTDDHLVDEDERMGFRLTTQQLERLVRSGAIFDLVEKAKEADPALAKALNSQLNRYLQQGKTEVLLAAYQALVKTRQQRSKEWHGTIRQVYYRQAPSVRLRAKRKQ